MLPFTQGQQVLEVGGGDRPSFRPNLDVRPMPTVDIVADLSQPWSMIADSSYDGVFSKYVFEHVSWRKVGLFAAELHRVLKPGGTAFVITANIAAQMEWALKQGDDAEKISQCLFGDMDYPENSHKAGFTPESAIRIFREAGFDAVAVIPQGELGTDMAIEARKGAAADPSTWGTAERRRAYDRNYFNGGRGGYGGYAFEGYWDYPLHWTTVKRIMEEKPESALELGCSRGYLIKRLQDAGIRAAGMEISEHCMLSRVCDGITHWDMTQTPWPYKDGEFDLAFSAATLEHIPESAMERIAAEIRRVTKRGLHGVDLGEHDDGFDKTHCTFKPVGWWLSVLNGMPESELPDVPPQRAIDKEELEKGDIPLPPSDNKLKLNCGSFTTMFHHGWTNIDVHPLHQFADRHRYIFEQRDLRQGFPFQVWKADLIYACHFLEHLTYQEGAKFLADCYGILKPGGLIRIAIPDAELLTKAYIAGELSKFDQLNEGCANSKSEARKLWELLLAGHQATYDTKAVALALRDAGFEKVEIQGFRQSLSAQMLTETIDVYPGLSGFVEAVKA